MIISVIALILFIGLVSVTLLGGRLRRLLPAEQLNDESKDAVKLALGLVATMLGAILTNARHKKPKHIMGNLVLLALALVVVWGRFGPYAFTA